MEPELEFNSALVDGTLWFAVGKEVNAEGAVPSEQEVNPPKPAKRARTSFTADQLQVNIEILILFFSEKKMPDTQKHSIHLLALAPQC